MRRRRNRGDHAHSRHVKQLATKHLHQNSRKVLKRVSCEYDSGVLYLRGRVRSYYHKQLAQESVMNLAGIEQVINEIEVIPTTRSHAGGSAGKSAEELSAEEFDGE